METKTKVSPMEALLIFFFLAGGLVVLLKGFQMAIDQWGNAAVIVLGLGLAAVGLLIALAAGMAQ